MVTISKMLILALYERFQNPQHNRKITVLAQMLQYEQSTEANQRVSTIFQLLLALNDTLMTINCSANSEWAEILSCVEQGRNLSVLTCTNRNPEAANDNISPSNFASAKTGGSMRCFTLTTIFAKLRMSCIIFSRRQKLCWRLADFHGVEQTL